MLNRSRMPFAPKPVDPKAEKVLADLDEVLAEIRKTDAERKRLLKRRARLINQARGYGVTLDALAKRLKVTRGRIQQLGRGE